MPSINIKRLSELLLFHHTRLETIIAACRNQKINALLTTARDNFFRIIESIGSLEEYDAEDEYLSSGPDSDSDSSYSD